ncbi:hypothetical protein BST61_g400 [Cercospora zeina]
MARKVKHTKRKSVPKDLLKLGALDGERANAYVSSSTSQNLRATWSLRHREMAGGRTSRLQRTRK